MFRNQLFIDGDFVDSKLGGVRATVNPFTGESLCEVAEASEVDVDAAVRSGLAAQAEWWALEPEDRSRVLWGMADAIETNGEELATLDCLDAGRPIADAREDIHASARMFRYFAGLPDKVHGATVPAQNDKLVYTRREPYGVIAAITAWNYPLFNASAKIAPILALGNSCVIKPAEETPLTTLRLAEVLAAVDGAPRGLVNVLTGAGETVGDALVRHSDVHKVSFTGSTATGRLIMRAAAESNLKGLTLELGGKAPVIVFEDADLIEASKAIAFSAFFNQGQTCTAATRVIVHKEVADELLSRVGDIASRVTVGDPQNEETTMGPLASRDQYTKVQGYVSRALERNETLAFGDPTLAHEATLSMEPLIFDDVAPDSELFRDEIFGPVLCFTRFDSDADAVALANASEYGLAAGLWTSSVGRMHRVAEQLRAGIIWGNTLFSENPGAPAGGFGQSGFGREYGDGAINEYSQVKTVWVDLSGEYFDWV